MIDLPALSAPDDVLSQPTRRRLFALLSELRRPAGTAELAEVLQLHPNGVRLHLERLAAAGLIERARVRQTRGRPPDAWTVAAGAQPGGRAPHAYHDLGRWLARALTRRSPGLGSIEETGRQIGRELAPESAGSAGSAPESAGSPEPEAERVGPLQPAESDPHALETTLTALGFQPIVTRRDGDELTVCLRNCPYRDVVRENPAAICALHKGITRGLIDVLEPQAKLTAFTPHDPDEAGCLIELRGLGRASATR